MLKLNELMMNQLKVSHHLMTETVGDNPLLKLIRVLPRLWIETENHKIAEGIE